MHGAVCPSVCGPMGYYSVTIFVGGVQGRQQGTTLMVLSHQETATLNSVSTAAGEARMPVSPQPRALREPLSAEVMSSSPPGLQHDK